MVHRAALRHLLKKNTELLLVELKESGKARNLERCRRIHEAAISSGDVCDIYVASTLVNVYAKCASMEEAQRVFDAMHERNVVSWTNLILGYADNGHSHTVLEMFAKMEAAGCCPSARTFVAVLKACSNLAAKEKNAAVSVNRGKRIQLLAARSGCDSDMFFESTLLDVYAKCGRMPEAREVFKRMRRRDSVTWNALMLGYADNGQSQETLRLFSQMRKEGCAPDARSFVAALKACSEVASKGNELEKERIRQTGKGLYLLAARNGWGRGVHVENALLDMYAKCGLMDEASRVFSSMQHREATSWSALILGYAENREGHFALDLFARMKREGYEPDEKTFVAVLKACGSLGALETGKQVHNEIRRLGLEFSIQVATSLIDFYAKCGSLAEVQEVFALHPVKDLVTWTALLGAYSYHGDATAVFELFDRMLDAGMTPNAVTFSCVLTACSHSGLVQRGKECFDSMLPIFGVAPDAGHYNSIVDMLGRAKRLDEAVSLVRSMPFEPDLVTWMTLLSSCKKWRMVSLGLLAFQSLLSIDYTNSAAYVLMGNLYGSRDMWEERVRMQALRSTLGVRKKPGKSWWTSSTGTVHSFCVRDKSHPQIELIQGKLKELGMKMKEGGYVANFSSVPQNLSDVDKEDALCGHSERLAIACALVNTPASSETIRIVKNLRVCDDCHAVTALISKLEKRTIVCRDNSRFHVFRDGECSCGDFW